MNWLLGLVQFVVALPKVWAIVKEIQGALQKKQFEQNEKRHQKAVNDLKKAETEDEIKKAMRDIARNP